MSEHAGIEDDEPLARARARLEAVQRIADLGAWEADTGGGRTWWSSDVYRILGIPGSSTPSYRLFLESVHPDDRDRMVPVPADAAGTRSYSSEHRILRTDGTVRHVRHDVESVVEDGRVVRLLGTVQDITDQITLTATLVDTESRRRELLHRLVRSSEHERAELAGDLHDGPIQALAVAAMRLEHLGMVDPDPPDWLAGAVQTVRDTVVQLRDVLVELHPRAGAGAGLDATLTELARTVVPDLDVEVAVGGETSEAEARAVFGIVQEALWDVRERDRARHLDIRVEAGDDRLELILTGGAGTPGAPTDLLGRAGLLGVRERVEGLGGRCTLEDLDGDPVVRCTLPRTAVGSARG